MKFLSFRKKSAVQLDGGGRRGSSPTAVMQTLGSGATSLGSGNFARSAFDTAEREQAQYRQKLDHWKTSHAGRFWFKGAAGVPHVDADRLKYLLKVDPVAAHKFYTNSIKKHVADNGPRFVTHSGITSTPSLSGLNVANYVEHQWSRHPSSQLRHDQLDPNALTPEEIHHQRMVHTLRLGRRRPVPDPQTASEAKQRRDEERRLLAAGVMPDGYEWERAPPENYFRALSV